MAKDKKKKKDAKAKDKNLEKLSKKELIKLLEEKAQAENQAKAGKKKGSAAHLTAPLDYPIPAPKTKPVKEEVTPDEEELFKMTPGEKIDSEYPAEINDILSVNDDDVLAEHLAYLQRRLKEYKVPVMIVLEGAYASGKGRIANELLLGLDARYTSFIDTRPPSEEELRMPFLQKYQESIPSYNKFNIYYRSWYSMYNYYKNHLRRNSPYKDPSILVDEIRSFEKALTNDGTVLIKFKIRIDAEKQAKHIKKMIDTPLTTWRAQDFDRDNNETYVAEMNHLIEATDEPYAPWYVVEYTKKSDTTVKVMRQVIEILNKRLEEEEAKAEEPQRDGLFTGNTEGPLSKVDLSSDISDEDYSAQLKPLQNQMRAIQYALYTERIPLILVFEGWDAAGKGGNIHRIIADLDPTNYTVNTTAAPNDLEKNHHYLWRFATKTPRAGHIAIWDRSWYGRVMVERIEGFATTEEWSRAYDEINDFEKRFTNFGGIVLKFFIHIDKQTQLERFEARQSNPAKSWKITDEDWRNREKWDQYTEAINDMIEKTSTKEAPWIVVPGNSKKYARIFVLNEILKFCDARLKSIDLADQSTYFDSGHLEEEILETLEKGNGKDKEKDKGKDKKKKKK